MGRSELIPRTHVKVPGVVVCTVVSVLVKTDAVLKEVGSPPDDQSGSCISALTHMHAHVHICEN